MDSIRLVNMLKSPVVPRSYLLSLCDCIQILILFVNAICLMFKTMNFNGVAHRLAQVDMLRFKEHRWLDRAPSIIYDVL